MLPSALCYNSSLMLASEINLNFHNELRWHYICKRKSDIKNLALPQKGPGEKHCIYFQQCPVDTHLKMLDLYLGKMTDLCFMAYNTTDEQMLLRLYSSVQSSAFYEVVPDFKKICG